MNVPSIPTCGYCTLHEREGKCVGGKYSPLPPSSLSHARFVPRTGILPPLSSPLPLSLQMWDAFDVQNVHTRGTNQHHLFSYTPLHARSITRSLSFSAALFRHHRLEERTEYTQLEKAFPPVPFPKPLTRKQALFLRFSSSSSSPPLPIFSDLALMPTSSSSYQRPIPPFFSTRRR